MRDPLDELRDFARSGDPVIPVPPAEVRRRGDRLRRRNQVFTTVGSVAAALVLIGTPLAIATSGADDDRAPDVAPAPSGGWRQEVPADWPLASGMPEDTLVVDDFSAEAPGPCGDEAWSPASPSPAADALSAIYRGVDTEGSEQRTIAVYADADAAAASVEAVRDQLAACEAPSGGFAIEAVEVPSALGEDSLTFVNRWYDESGEPTGEAHVHQVVQVGNAVLYATGHFLGGMQPAVVDETVRDLQVDTAYTVTAMCLFALDPCGSVPEPSEPPASADEGGPTTIPSGFPLADGLTGDEVVGPSADGDGVDLTAMCGAGRAVWPGRPADRLAATGAGTEFNETRELVAFESAEQASAAVERVRAALASCPTVEDRTYTRLDAPVVGEESLTFAFTYAEGTGGSVYQLVRVGNAVLATSSAAEWTADTVEEGAAEITRRNALVVEEMAVFAG